MESGVFGLLTSIASHREGDHILCIADRIVDGLDGREVPLRRRKRPAGGQAASAQAE